jgi:hypothetical protein
MDKILLYVVHFKVELPQFKILKPIKTHYLNGVFLYNMST